MRVAVSGASGLIGSALTTRLTASGHTVVPMSRPNSKAAVADNDGAANNAADHISWNPADGTIDTDSLATCDAVVHLAGPGIADHRWTDDYRKELVDARVDGTALIATTLADLGAEGPSVMISGSAIGWYGDRGDTELTERSAPGEGFLPSLCQAWEAAADPARNAGVRVATIRTGIVLSADGGALPKMVTPFRFFVGGRFGSGKQWMSWISMDDEVAAIEFLLTNDVEGAFNLTSPHPVTNADFVRALGAALSRPSWLPVPAFGPRLLLGRDLADALLFESARVLPDALTSAGFAFEYPDLSKTLSHVLHNS